ncbi:MAG: CatB-related O-acetyltransferase [Patescibacteria group bacterium]|jgi:acetyltransferase-like isoleucine patch superfamily enzyme
MILIPNLDRNILPYPLPQAYAGLLKNWLKKNPWVTIGDGVTFPLKTKVLKTKLEIKEGTIINGPMVVKGSGNVTIGKYGGIAENLYIISSNHKTNYIDVSGMFTEELDINKGPVYIGNNVWIGDNVTILSGVTIGDGAVIGTGSIVTHDVPDFAIAAGVPAKVIKYRFSEKVIDRLINIGWWHWDYKTIIENKFFFKEEINEKNIDQLTKLINLNNDNEVTDINFQNNNSLKWLLDGWGSKEENYRWAEKNKAGLIFKIKDPAKYNSLLFSCRSYYLPQKINISINKKFISAVRISNNWSEYKVNITNLKKGVNILRVTFEKGFSPFFLKQGNDKRNLFCCFSGASLV